MKLVRQALAEFVGTFFLTFMGPGAVCAAVAGGAGGSIHVQYALSFGITIFAVASSIGDDSGCHINPAVTFAMLITKNIPPINGAVYIIAQLIGGIAGGGFLRAMVGENNYVGGLGINDNIPLAGAFFFEVIGTFFLVFVVFQTALWSADPKNFNLTVANVLAPLPIGLTVTVCHLVLGAFTGCGINPARALGTSAFETSEWWDSDSGKNFWIYFIGPLLGAAMGIAPYWLMYGTCKPGSGHTAKPQVAPKEGDAAGNP